MIKSAHLTGSVSRQAGGLFDAVRNLVRAQQRQGMGVKVFGLQDEFSPEDLPAWNPVPVAAFPPAWPNGLGRAPGFIEALEAFAPDISHTHGLWRYSSIAANRHHRAGKCPYLVSPHGMLDPWALRNSRWKKQVAWWLFEQEHVRGARCLRALCASEAHSIRELGLNNEIAVIPNGIDLPEFENAKTRNAESLKSADENPPWAGRIEPGQKVLLFLSRIHPKKGLINLLKAWAENRTSDIGHRQSGEWVLAIAGWDQGGHEAELKSLASELGLVWADVRGQKLEAGMSEIGNRKSEIGNVQSSLLHPPSSVVFLGPQFNAAKAACYRHCDAFVLPSFSEGLPMVVLEAWAYGKPVFMTPECNLPEGFQAGAALQMAATEAGVAAGLRELQGLTQAERMEMGRRARELVVARFTWSRVGEQLQAVQAWILGGGAKPDCVIGA